MPDLKMLGEDGIFGSGSGAYSDIERQIRVDRKLQRHIEKIRGMACSASIKKKT